MKKKLVPHVVPCFSINRIKLWNSDNRTGHYIPFTIVFYSGESVEDQEKFFPQFFSFFFQVFVSSFFFSNQFPRSLYNVQLLLLSQQKNRRGYYTRHIYLRTKVCFISLLFHGCFVEKLIEKIARPTWKALYKRGEIIVRIKLIKLRYDLTFYEN